MTGQRLLLNAVPAPAERPSRIRSAHWRGVAVWMFGNAVTAALTGSLDFEALTAPDAGQQCWRLALDPVPPAEAHPVGAAGTVHGPLYGSTPFP